MSAPREPGLHLGRSAKRRDAAMNAAASAIFSVSLGMLGVGIPLLALHAGYNAAQVGLLVALSAIAQLVTRSVMGMMMRKLPEKIFAIVAALLIALSCGLIAASLSLLAFLASQVAQGMARACFFTATHTHAVRVSDNPVRAITNVNLASGIGGFAGPALAGILLEVSGQVTMTVGMLIGLAGMIPGLLLLHLPPFQSHRYKGADRAMGQPGVQSGIWMGAVAGSWKGLLDSFVPIVLTFASQTAATIGLLVAVANAALFIGTGMASLVRRAGLRGSLVIGVAAAAIGMGTLGPLAGYTVAAAAMLALSGLGAGVLQTVGPGVAAESVPPDQKGDAITLVGLARAAALFLAPMGMSGVVVVVPVTGAFVVASVVMALPTLSTLRKPRH